MSFRCRQKLRLAFGSSVVEPEEVELPSGIFQTEMTDSCQKTMPNPVFFDLKNQLDSGINLEEVNSKIMSSKTVDASQVIRKYIKKTTEVKNEGE